ncbi:MAG: hypothetical protein SGJ27_22555 [Candidatus Melainabacteria bacterium]|nr:hypothetical protein [Candidatus Melainabacteria bacterium]
MKLPQPISALVKALGFVCRMPGRLNRSLHEAIEDWTEMAPYHIKLMTSSFSNSPPVIGVGALKNQPNAKRSQFSHMLFRDEFTRREMICWHFISYDRMLFGKLDPITGRQWMNLADLYWEYRRPGDARSYYQKALKIFLLSCKKTDDRLIEAKKKLANCYLTIGSYVDTERLLLEVLQALDEKIVELSVLEAANPTTVKPTGDARRASETSKPKIVDVIGNLRAERVANLLVLAETQKHLKKFQQAIETLALVVDVFESGGKLPRGEQCLAVYLELSKVYTALGESSQSNLYHSTAKQLDFVRIMESAVGRESRSLARELEPLVVLYQKRKKFDIVQSIRKQIELCELASKVSTPINYKGIESDLERLAKHYDARDDYGDSTVAFHLRARIKRILRDTGNRVSMWMLLATGKMAWLLEAIELNEAFYATMLARLF